MVKMQTASQESEESSSVRGKGLGGLEKSSDVGRGRMLPDVQKCKQLF